MTTDVTEYVIREVALRRGLVDNKVCAVDETWSGLRLVWRKERRTTSPANELAPIPPPPPPPPPSPEKGRTRRRTR